jgi:hypothetical protein
VDKACKKGTEFEAFDLLYLDVKVAHQHMIAMHERLLLALWKLQCYNGLDHSLLILPYLIVMPCNTAIFEGYVYFDALMSVDVVE